MNEISVGLAALAATALLLWRSIGPESISDRVAAALAFTGMQAVVAPTHLGTWVRQLGDWTARTTGHIVAGADVSVGAAVAAVLIPLTVAGVGVAWVAAMLPQWGPLAKWGGQIIGLTFDKGLIWGGAIVLGVFAAAAPGGWGHVLVNATAEAATLGHQLITTALA